ncbi:hypothetical protein J2782_004429 [Brucella pseudogrignonensis]|uniref:Uncharacterized protein n=1 Tax=Brucella pseudogrignonensis TaxID=419475 RepID=A0ABU1MGE2_9HYPH|nr:hypothetical protein [Brucella pseudogrignonensis]
MFLKFHLKTNGKCTMLPYKSVQYVQNHDDGGATIVTDIPSGDPNKPRTFNCTETVEDLYGTLKSDFPLPDGVFSLL